jgi:mono/diheme cytochrome c family protein
MRWVHRCLAASFLLLVGLVVRGAAQTPPPAPAAESTLGGVYTADQAKRGEESYMNICVGCHSAGTYQGKSFLETWAAGRPLSDLYDQMAEKMPKDDPGSLEPKEYAQILAYILKKNGLPEGKAELPADSATLKKIRFETAKAP